MWEWLEENGDHPDYERIRREMEEALERDSRANGGPS